VSGEEGEECSVRTWMRVMAERHTAREGS
jgi:hypothetical protein